MHLLLSLLGTLVTVLWLLHRLAEMGIDFGGLNPWVWRRRRKWQKQYHANPAYSVEKPMEALALVLTAVAKTDGDLSSEEKAKILSLFETKFHLSQREASDLLASSVHLLGRGDEVRANPQAVLAPSLGQFSKEQRESAISMLNEVANIGGIPGDVKAEYLQQITNILSPAKDSVTTWS